MIVSEIKLFELLKAKIGEKEAEAFVELLETKVDRKFKDAETIFKGDMSSLKEYMDKVFATKADLANVKVDIIKWMFLFWIGQLASFIAIAKFIFHQ